MASNDNQPAPSVFKMALPMGSTHTPSPSSPIPSSSTQSTDIPQLDGPRDRRLDTNPTISGIVGAAQRPTSSMARAPTASNDRAAANTAADLLPYCATDRILSQQQVIALSDVVGSIAELGLLALGATVDEEPRRVLEGAVGPEVAASIIEFFREEIVADL